MDIFEFIPRIYYACVCAPAQKLLLKTIYTQQQRKLHTHFFVLLQRSRRDLRSVYGRGNWQVSPDREFLNESYVIRKAKFSSYKNNSIKDKNISISCITTTCKKKVIDSPWHSQHKAANVVLGNLSPAVHHHLSQLLQILWWLLLMNSPLHVAPDMLNRVHIW